MVIDAYPKTKGGVDHTVRSQNAINRFIQYVYNFLPTPMSSVSTRGTDDNLTGMFCYTSGSVFGQQLHDDTADCVLICEVWVLAPAWTNVTAIRKQSDKDGFEWAAMVNQKEVVHDRQQGFTGNGLPTSANGRAVRRWRGYGIGAIDR